MSFAKTEMKSYEERKEIAKKIVNGLVSMGMKYHDARSILGMAQEELGNRRSNEIISEKTPPTGDA